MLEFPPTREKFKGPGKSTAKGTKLREEREFAERIKGPFLRPKRQTVREDGTQSHGSCQWGKIAGLPKSRAQKNPALVSREGGTLSISPGTYKRKRCLS
jgi:hypothetical protein